MTVPKILLALALLGSLPAWSAAVATQPQRTTGGATVSVKAIQDARPTLELMVTVKLLADLVQRRAIAPDIQASQALSGLLRPLLGAGELRPADASGLEAAVHQLLAPSQEAAVKQARAALDARAQAFMARARFAAPDGPPNLTLIRYGLTVPGGQAAVTAVLGANFNPYGQAGVNIAVLERLLELLGK